MSRSELMSRIGPRDTKPEKVLRSSLHRMGLRFRIAPKHLPGKPDIVLSKFSTAIFVHGCFWHRHQGCAKTTFPKTNAEFWNRKFIANVARDKRNKIALEDKGWKVLIIWECELVKNEKESIRMIVKEILKDFQ